MTEDEECQLYYVNGPIIVEMGFDGSKGPGGAAMRRWSSPLEPKDNIPVSIYIPL